MNDQNNIPGQAADGSDEYRDGELAAHLNAERVPQHAPSFWSDLQNTIDAEAGDQSLNGARRPSASPLESDADPVASPTTDPTVEMALVLGQGGPDAAAQLPTDEMINVIPLSGRRARTRVPLVLSAAAVLLLAIAAVALLSRSDDATSIQSADEDGQETTELTEPEPETDLSEDSAAPEETADPDEDASSTIIEDLPELPADYFGASATTAIGTGSFVDFSPDGSSVLLLVDVDTGETGCEGAPLLQLVSQSLATGERVAAWPAGATIETGGIEVRVVDPDAAGGEVYLTEYCDGSRGATWEATMAPNGVVSDLVEIEAEGLSDPFTTSGLPTAEAVGARALAPWQPFGAFIEEQQLTVRRLGDSEDEWTAPAEIVATDVVWDPSGQVLAVTSTDGVWFWNFRTDESMLVPSSTTYWTADFDRSGTQLALVASDERGLLDISIMTFGEAPVPAEHTRTETPAVSCSGSVELAPLDIDELVASGVAVPVAQKAVAVDAAAATCDWDGLAELTGPDFVASFGGDDPIEIWQEAEDSNGVMDTLRVVLRQPLSVNTEGEQPLYTWPAVFARGGCADYTDDDRQSLRNLGYSGADITAECDAAGGYQGYRTGFDGDGNWLLFVAGD